MDANKMDKIAKEIETCRQYKHKAVKDRRKYRFLKWGIVLIAGFVEGYAFDYAEKIGWKNAEIQLEKQNIETLKGMRDNED